MASGLERNQRATFGAQQASEDVSGSTRWNARLDLADPPRGGLFRINNLGGKSVAKYRFCVTYL